MRAERIIDYIMILAFFLWVNARHARAIDIQVGADLVNIAGALALVWFFAKMTMSKSILKG